MAGTPPAVEDGMRLRVGVTWQRGSGKRQEYPSTLAATKIAIDYLHREWRPFVRDFLDGQRRRSSEAVEQAATAMLDELATWTAVLQPIRQPDRAPAAIA